MRVRQIAAAIALLISLASVCVQVSTAQTCQLTVALVLDISGSMRNVVPEWNVTKAAVQLEAASLFVSDASSDWRIGVVEYRDSATIRIAATADKNATLSSMSGTGKGDTNLAEGINLAMTLLTNASYGRLVMIIVGDGNPNIGVDPRQRAIDASALAKKNGIYVLTAGLTLSPSAYALMKAMASNAQYTLNALEVNSLKGWFRTLQGRLCNMVEETAPDASEASTALSERNMLAWIALAALLTAVSLLEYRRQIIQRFRKGADIGPQKRAVGFRERLKRFRIRKRGGEAPSPITAPYAIQPAAERVCEHCGRSILTSDNFCDGCGRAVSRSY